MILNFRASLFSISFLHYLSILYVRRSKNLKLARMLLASSPFFLFSAKIGFVLLSNSLYSSNSF